MPLTLTLRTPLSIPLEVESIRWEVVREQSADQVSTTLIQSGNRQAEIGEFFHVAGSAADGTLVWQGDLQKVKRIGAGQPNGRVIVEGNAGMHLGSEMTGGEIEVKGNVGDWMGAQMKGGRILVSGSAGDLVGAVYRGGRRGMTGGEIVIAGRAGNEVGVAMRRGLIVVGDSAGDFAGAKMIAGSILVLGNAGIRHGAGMKRGTIGLFGPRAPELLPTFSSAGLVRPLFLNLISRRLKALGFSNADRLRDLTVRRYCGDALASGKGEVLVAAA